MPRRGGRFSPTYQIHAKSHPLKSRVKGASQRLDTMLWRTTNMGFKKYTGISTAHKPRKFCVLSVGINRTAHKCTTGACVVYRPRQQRVKQIITHNKGVYICKNINKAFTSFFSLFGALKDIYPRPLCGVCVCAVLKYNRIPSQLINQPRTGQ